MLATEGRRRRIPLLTAFLALAHLVNLSFAQNLFFLALLFTPSPLLSGDGDLRLPVLPLRTSPWTRLRNKLIPPKPNGWVPNAVLLHTAIALNFGLTMTLPYAAGTSTFANLALLARASTFLPVLLPKIIPVHWGRVQSRSHGTYESFVKLFKFLSGAAFATHAKTTLVALLSNAPNSHYHRHSALLPWDVEHRSLWERSTSAFGKVLGSTSDHPVVAAVGWDVLLCGLSLGLWAAVRGISVRDMMNASVPPYNYNLSNTKRSSPEKGDLRDDTLEPGETESENENEHDEYSPTLRRRGKTARSRVSSMASSSGASEHAQGPTTPPSKRGRGRPRKTRPVTTDDTEEELSPSLSRQARKTKEAAEDEDDAYVPTPAVARSALEGDEPPPPVPDWESASLAWGLAAFGGLASACTGVFGGECTSR